MQFRVTAGTSRRPLFTLGGPVAAVVAVAYLTVVVVTLDDKADRVGEQAGQARRLSAQETPLMTSQLGWVNHELRRETGRYAPDAATLLDAAALRLGEPHGERWRRALSAHPLDTRGDAGSFEIVMHAYADGGPAFRLFVDLDARRVEQTCTGSAPEGCGDGRWDSGEAAHIPAGR